MNSYFLPQKITIFDDINQDVEIPMDSIRRDRNIWMDMIGEPPRIRKTASLQT